MQLNIFIATTSSSPTPLFIFHD